MGEKRELFDASKVHIKYVHSVNWRTKETMTKTKNAMLEWKTKLEAKHHQALINLQQKLEREYSNALAQFRMQHVIDLENEKEQFSAQIDSLKKELFEKVADMKNKMQAVIEAKNNIEEELESKYQKIVAGIKAKAELDRTQLMEQGKGSTRCMCCGDALKVEVFCNKRCLQMWKTWEQNDQNESEE